MKYYKIKLYISPKTLLPFFTTKLTPGEKTWWKMKRAFAGKLHKTLEEHN